MIRRTKGNEILKLPLAGFEAATALYKERYDAWTRARLEASVRIRLQHEAEDNLDQELRGVALALLFHSRGRKNDEQYRRYFPGGYGSALRLPPEQALEVSAGVLAAMDAEERPEILARREPMRAARSRLEETLADRQAAADARGEAKALVEEAKLAWRMALQRYYYEARMAYFGRIGYVEWMFAPTGRRRQDEEDPAAEDAPAEEPPAAPAAASVPQLVLLPARTAPRIPPLTVREDSLTLPHNPGHDNLWVSRAPDREAEERVAEIQP